ncbi:MAG: type 1 glutamine amidotransferase [Bryobacterales bacterium]|nr:type 1 glutamine amidotransferase [Bryobacterales bacterium]MBV9396901.1 type 1 glutamine amidotransferase [Bryobacterales bacterium]
MASSLTGKRVAILVADGFEQVEMTGPREALDQAGAKTDLISPASDRVHGWNHFDKADEFTVDVPLESANPNDYDALMLPGGVANPDQLRTYPKAVQFVKSFFDQGKPVAAICHGPWLLAEADVIRGRTLTSWPSIRTDLRNAGANVVDREVVVDRNLITSRKPADIPAFTRKMIDEFRDAGVAIQGAGASKRDGGKGTTG